MTLQNIQEIEFRYPPFKFIKETDSATGKTYFKNNSANINNVAIKTADKTVQIYQIESISVLPGNALRQNSNYAYLVVQNKGKKDATNKVFLCFKLEPGNESSLDVFNGRIGINRLEIATENPSSTIQLSADRKIIILDSPVKIDKIPVLSKFHNIIGSTDLTFNTITISNVKQVTTKASCSTVPDTLDNVMSEKQQRIIHAVMLCLTLLITAGALVMQTQANNISILINNALLGLWFLLVIIVAPTAQKLKTVEMAQTVLVVKYLVLNIAIFALILNYSELKKSLSNQSNLINKIKEFILAKNEKTIQLIVILLGIVYTMILFST